MNLLSFLYLVPMLSSSFSQLLTILPQLLSSYTSTYACTHTLTLTQNCNCHLTWALVLDICVVSTCEEVYAVTRKMRRHLQRGAVTKHFPQIHKACALKLHLLII